MSTTTIARQFSKGVSPQFSFNDLGAALHITVQFTMTRARAGSVYELYLRKKRAEPRDPTCEKRRDRSMALNASAIGNSFRTRGARGDSREKAAGRKKWGKEGCGRINGQWERVLRVKRDGESVDQRKLRKSRDGQYAEQGSNGAKRQAHTAPNNNQRPAQRRACSVNHPPNVANERLTRSRPRDWAGPPLGHARSLCCPCAGSPTDPRRRTSRTRPRSHHRRWPRSPAPG